MGVSKDACVGGIILENLPGLLVRLSNNNFIDG